MVFPRVLSGVLLAAIGAARLGAAGWDRAVADRIDAANRQRPFSHLAMEPGERIRYRMESRLHPPRIPFFSSGRTIAIDMDVEFASLGLSEAGYDLLLRLDASASDPSIPVEPHGLTRFRLSPLGERGPSLGADEETGLANASQLMRDLTRYQDPSQPWSENRWFYLYPSPLGARRILTECRYQPERIDPATGNLEARIRVEEAPEERRRRRGFNSEGRVVIDPQGRLVSLQTTGRVWKKALFFTVSIPADYTVERVPITAPRTPARVSD